MDASSSSYMQLTNIYGVPVKTALIGNVDNGTQTLDVSSLVPGTYFLIFNNGAIVFREEIIKQ
ncbi:T9SS type A sorting domain-containing protein [[Flexibacter] sp. ATCC 35208]|uniref:T9SS type A sorting domain-containing protein n=1 Tax=[Flexibacter] sp. ATCC 35208 TaxID=1936242 RepID=UPI0034D38834